MKEKDAILQIRSIHKAFSDTPVINGIDLSIQRGEFITLLGSSGCGKTTTLRIIAGLEQPDSGSIILEGEDVTNLEPNRRDVNMVFQNYALFPHMNVEVNIGYSLKIKKTPKSEIKTRVHSMLELVQLEGYEKRMPSELSGGQKQRVAIARSLINEPKILLLDEPLGALDLQLRRQMQIELKRLQKKLGITFIYITHDQEEALNMSDRVVVMDSGTFQQIGTPSEVYDKPRTSFVAQFVGSANIVKGHVSEINGTEVTIQNHDGTAVFFDDTAKFKLGMPVTLSIRGEQSNLQKINEKLNINENILPGSNPSKNPALEITNATNFVSEPAPTIKQKSFASTAKDTLSAPSINEASFASTPKHKNLARSVKEKNQPFKEKNYSGTINPAMGTVNGTKLVGTVKEKSFAGGMLRITVVFQNKETFICSRQGIDSELQPGDAVQITWEANHAVPVDLEPFEGELL